jgi:hypothetical protein
MFPIKSPEPGYFQGSNINVHLRLKQDTYICEQNKQGPQVVLVDIPIMG